MKPVDQTIMGFPDGNCYAACLASILELSLDEIPVGLGKKIGDAFYEEMNLFLQRFGYGILLFEWDRGAPWFAPADTWHILSGPSPRGDFFHATVGQGGKVIHDPHPSRAGLLGTKREVEVFILRDPSLSKIRP